jgi:hypothetical protein
VLARRHDALLVALAGLVLAAVADALIRDEHRPVGDDVVYTRMADDPLGTHTFPFAYRIAVPWIVHVLPFGHTFSFNALALLCAAASGGVAYALMRRFGAPAWLAAGLALGLVVSPPLLVVFLREGRNSDAASVLVMLVGALFVADRRPVALGVTLLLGAFVRESTLFLVPFAYAYWAARPWDPAVLRRVAAAAAPGVAAYVALRLAVPTVGRAQVPGYGAGAIAGRWDNVKAGVRSWKIEGRRLLSAFGPLWVCLPWGIAGLRFARAGLTILALCAVSATFALDWGRIFFLAAPVIYVAAAWVARDRRWLGVVLVAGLAALDVGYAIHMQVSGVVHGIEGAGPPPYPLR